MDQLVAFVGALVCAITAFIPDSSDRENLSRNRRIFWGATGAAMVFAFLGLLPDWRHSLEAAFAVGALFFLLAFRDTPYLRSAEKYTHGGDLTAWRNPMSKTRNRATIRFPTHTLARLPPIKPGG